MIDWIVIEGEYRAGVRSVNAIAGEHGISETAIRKRAKRLGWSRDPVKTQRKRVAAHFAGSNQGSKLALRTMAEATADSIADMNLGLSNARLIMGRVADMILEAIDPKELKILSECNRINLEAIRLIRGLDDTGAAALINQNLATVTPVQLRQIARDIYSA